MADLTAKLIGVEEGLEDALDSVAEASRKVNSTLENLDDKLEEVGSASQKAKSGLKSADEAAESLTESAGSAVGGVEKLEGSFENIKFDAETLQITINQLGDKFNNATADALGLKSGIDRVGEKATDTTGKLSGLTGISQLLSSANVQTAATSRLAGNGIEQMGDAADDATDDLIGTASAAELLSLRSSALSINVGFFTIALRNLTTQIPLLVTSLGNLTAAFTGLGTAIGGVGIGGLGVAFGGALAKAEEAGANLNDFQSVMEALEPTSQAFQEALIQALDPLVETQGAIETFDALLQTVVNTVHAFSRATKAAFEIDLTGVDDVQSLQATLMGINEAVNENLDEIAGAVADLVIILGDELEAIFSGALEALPGFIRDVAVATEQVIDIVDVATDGLGNFVEELTRLGRAIGAGVAPVLSTFFTIVGDAVDSLILTQEEINNFNEATQNVEGAASSAQEALSGFRMETIASAAKVVALLLAVNRLASILGAVVTPLAAAGASIASLSSKASGALSGFALALDNVSGLIGRNIGGIGRLSQAFELLLPPIGQNTSLLTGLRRKLTGVSDSEQETASETQQLTNELRELRLAFNGVEEEAEEAGEAMEDARPGAFTRLRSALSSAGEKFNELKTKQDGIFAGFTDDLSPLINSHLPSFNTEISSLSRSLINTRNTALMPIGAGMRKFSKELQNGSSRSEALSESVKALGISLKNASNSTQGLGQFFKEIGDGNAATVLKGKLRGALETVGGGFIFASAKARGFAASIGSAITSPISTSTKALRSLGDAFITSVETISIGVLKGISGGLKIISGAANVATKSVNAFGSALLRSVGAVVTDTLKGIAGGFNILSGAADVAKNSVRDFVRSLLSIGSSGLRSTLVSLGNVFVTFAHSVMVPGRLSPVINSLATEFGNLKPSIDSSISSVESFSDAVDVAGNKIPNFSQKAGALRQSLTSVIDPSDGASSKLVEFKDRVGDIGQSIITGSESLGLLEDGLTSLPGPLSGAGNSLKGFRSEVEESGVASGVAGTKIGKLGKIIGSLHVGRVGPLINSLATLKSTKLGAATSAIVYSNTLDNLTTQMVESGGASMALGESIEEAKEEMDESGSVTSSLKSALSTFSAQLATTGGTAGIFASSIEEAKEEMNESGSATSSLKSGLSKLSAQFAGTGGVSGLFAQSVEDAKEEMNDSGSKSSSLYAAMATLSGGFITAAMSGSLLGSTTSANTTKFAVQTAVVKGLKSAIKSLAIVSAVMAAGFLAVVAVVGTAAAALMTLGSSGQDAESLISGLIDTLKNIGRAVMPLVVTAGNAMLDVFDSIKAVGGALIGGLKEIGAALGLVSESSGDGGGPMQMLKNAIDTIQPVIAAVGDLTRKFAEALIPAIRDTAEGFAKFLNNINAEERIKAIVKVIKDTVKALGGLEGIMDKIVSIAGPFFDALVKMSVIIGIVGTAALIATGKVSLLNIALGITSALVGAISSPFVLAAAAIIAVVGAIGLLLKHFGLLDPLFNAVIGATKGLINIILDLVGVIVSVTMKAVGALVDAGQKFLAAISPVITAFKAVASALKIIGQITATIVGVIVGLLGNIVSYIIDVLAPVFIFLLDSIGFVFGNIITVIGGVIDTIMGLAGFFISAFMDPLGAIEGLFSGIKDFVMGIFDFIVSTFGRLGGIIKELFMGIVGTIIDAFLNIPSALKGAFDSIVQGIKDAIAGAWNSTIGGFEIIPSFSIPGIPMTPFNGIDFNGVAIPEIGQDSDGGGSTDEGSGGGSSSNDSDDANIQDNDRTQDDLVGGGTTLANAGRRGTQAASDAMAPGNGDVKVEEGDVTNVFNQDISADPEDEVQIGRIAKDAMEEAESFKRRQQGSQ